MRLHGQIKISNDEPSTAREALVRGAVRVIARDGLRGMTLRMVATEARLSHGLIRFHFGSRDALIEATMEYAAQHSLSGATATATMGSDADDDLAEIGAHLRDIAEDAEETLAFHLEIMAEARRRPELLPLARRIVEGFEEAVHAQLQAHGYGDPDLVILVAAAMDGLVQRQTVTGDGEATDRAMTLFRAMLKPETRSADSTSAINFLNSPV